MFVSNQALAVTPNQDGEFDEINGIAPQEAVPLEIAYPNASEGDSVVILVADGGLLDNEKKIKILRLDSSKKVSFVFTTGSDPGIYRIVLNKGVDTKVVQLWVGQ